MNTRFKNSILQATGADDLSEQDFIQQLWSGYGTLKRYVLHGAARQSIIVKHVDLSQGARHPRGWDTNLSHTRKLKSYQVEMAWYQTWSCQCTDGCRVPESFVCESADDRMLIVLEDLDAAGYAERHHSGDLEIVKTCLQWLAHFHANFLGCMPDNLWDVGTYWHLATRPDELSVLDDAALKSAAPVIDQKLNNAQFKTIVHGDAKLANFCFSQDNKKVAAVDFQYVGGGCGMKDVAYFIGSCLYEEECEMYEQELLDYYFDVLGNVIRYKRPDIDEHDVINEWRLLFPVAWTDFHRFIKGWSPEHWKINSYSERIARQTVEQLCN